MTGSVWLVRLVHPWKVTDVCERVSAAGRGKLSWLSEWTSDVGIATFEKVSWPQCVHAYT